MDNKLKLKVILGSTRPSRFSDKPGNWIYDKAREKDNLNAELLDLRDYPMPFFNEPISPAMVEDGAYPNAIVRKWAKKINEGDAFVIVTPEYNHGTSGVLKNALDSIYTEWNNKPVGFVSYGGVGGARAVEQLRAVAVQLQMAPIQNAVHIQGGLWDMLDKNGNLKNDAFADYEKSAQAMVDQLEWWGQTLKEARNK